MTPLDVDEVERKWLQVCGPCDAGVYGECSHPDEDYRLVMSALVDEVRHLRAQRVKPDED